MVMSSKKGANAYHRYFLILLNESKNNENKTSELNKLVKEEDWEVMKHDRSKGYKVMHHFLFA